MNIMLENKFMMNVNAIASITSLVFKGYTFKQNSMSLNNPVFYKLVKPVKDAKNLTIRRCAKIIDSLLIKSIRLLANRSRVIFL